MSIMEAIALHHHSARRAQPLAVSLPRHNATRTEKALLNRATSALQELKEAGLEYDVALLRWACDGAPACGSNEAVRGLFAATQMYKIFHFTDAQVLVLSERGAAVRKRKQLLFC